MTLIFGIGVNLDPRQKSFEGRGQRSMPKSDKTCFVITDLSCFKVKVISRSKVKSRSKVGVQRSILGAWLAQCTKGNYRQVWNKQWPLPVQWIRPPPLNPPLGASIGGFTACKNTPWISQQKHGSNSFSVFFSGGGGYFFQTTYHLISLLLSLSVSLDTNLVRIEDFPLPAPPRSKRGLSFPPVFT